MKILPPSMKDAAGAVCEDLHYGLVKTEAGYELHKIIDEKGLEWLEKAVYPVVIDPEIETVEDWWQWTGMRFPSSGEFAVPGALVPVRVDHARGVGEYVEPNVWYFHAVDRGT